MLDAILALFALITALVLRLERLRLLRPLTGPLLATAAAALAHLLVTTFDAEDVVKGWAEVALVLVVGFLAAKASLLVFFDWILARRMGVALPRLVQEVAALIVYLVLGLILLHSLGIEVTGLLATSAVITVVVGLALQQTLGNLLAGLALAWEQRLVTGMWIELDGEVGRIEETGWRSLVVRTRLGDRVLVPNSDVAAARIAILGRGSKPVAVPVHVGVAYSVPPDAAKEVLARVAADTPGVVARPAPQILTTEFADSAVVYECRLWTQTPWRKEPLTDQFLTRAHAALARADMEIPFPQRTLHRARRRPPVDTVERKQEVLAASELFAELPEDALAALAEFSQLRRYAPGEAVVRKGDASTAVYLVASGEAVVQFGNREVSRIPSGDVFGEMGFLTGDERSATVRASGSALEVIEIDDTALRHLLEEHSELAERLAERMVERQLHGEELRDETGAIVSPRGLVSQIRNRFLRLVGRSDSDE